MTATVLSLADRLPPEAPVHRDQTLQNAAVTFLLVRLALDQSPPSPSELIDELVHTTDPRRRRELADTIGRIAP